MVSTPAVSFVGIRSADWCVMCSGKLHRIDQMFPVSLEQAMTNYDLPEAEVVPAARFIRACLHLNPEERSSATDLEAHPG
ncbi:hypothetical protein J3R83DRAFT_5642 [Lanmaoa asiatica]|nr:hypothetical protein J3R83DRAFT_5642 [Lanmaoa asiatica]